ncbi:hypothetical protein A3A84_01145 [Candidatus Collierbacteria bacterium RIFCSPLOWO2_01_FULL_50_23]|nr:MAG: hypothetical protein A3A84_01145 [Candidatus Collierbacteria bacterium RIFCSPLOWO2_01_FULL_50_23]
MNKQVLGTRVDLVTRDESFSMIRDWLELSGGRPKIVMTAYSEFFVTALRDVDFGMVLEGADLVTPDGIGPLAAIYFQGITKSSDHAVIKFLKGIQTGAAILSGRVGLPVSGYWLFKTLVGQAGEKGWKVFLLGGFGDTAERLSHKLRSENKELRVESDAGAQNGSEMEGAANEKVIEKINRFAPDLLFVAYGPVKQEKWLMASKGRLNARVAMGVGGTFDEALGKIREAPVLFERIGLKWLWRLLQQPQRLPRIFKATVVFAWLVFAKSLRSGKK